MTVVIVLVILAAIVAFFVLRSSETLRFETSSDPHRVVMAAIGIVGGKRRWQTMSQSPHGVSFQYHKGPKKLTAFVLLVCFIVPGIVYVALAGKRESLVVNIDPAAEGLGLVQATSNGWRGKGAGRALRRQVGLPAG